MGINLSSRSKQIILLVVSAIIYVLWSNWKVALILMVSLAIHELGHAWAIKRQGIDVDGIYFIPLLGASTNLKGISLFDLPFEQRFFVAIMGLVWSLALAVASAIVYGLTGNPFFAGATSIGALIICLNMVPLNLSDGGKVLIPIALPKIKKETFAVFNLTFALMISLLWHDGSMIMLLLGLWGIHDFNSGCQKEPACPEVPRELATKYIVVCLAIITTALGLLIYVSSDWIKYLVS